MICKTHKDIYNSVSGKMNIDENIVKSIGDFYYKDISERISDFKNREIYINKLGVFRFRKAASLRWMKGVLTVEKTMKAKNRTEESIKETLEKVESKKVKMQVLVDEWNEIIAEYKKHKEQRRANRDIQE
jgi:hypothetical protein